MTRVVDRITLLGEVTGEGVLSLQVSKRTPPLPSQAKVADNTKTSRTKQSTNLDPPRENPARRKVTCNQHQPKSTADLLRVEIGLDEHLQLLQHEVFCVFFAIGGLRTGCSTFNSAVNNRRREDRHTAVAPSVSRLCTKPMLTPSEKKTKKGRVRFWFVGDKKIMHLGKRTMNVPTRSFSSRTICNHPAAEPTTRALCPYRVEVPSFCSNIERSGRPPHFADFFVSLRAGAQTITFVLKIIPDVFPGVDVVCRVSIPRSSTVVTTDMNRLRGP